MTESLISLAIATLLFLGSPGPAPLALAATGAAFGIKRGLAFLFGILAGLAFVILATSLGLAALLQNLPELRLFLQLLGGLYIIYLAFKIAGGPLISPLENPDNAQSKPPNFIDGLILNLLNPKLYAAMLALMSQYQPESITFYANVIAGLTCFTVATFVDIVWLGFGRLLRPLFASPIWARRLRISFAVLMVLAVIKVLWS